MFGQILGDRLDRRPDPRIIGGKEAKQRDQKQRGVERVGVVVLAKDAVSQTALKDLLADRFGRLLPIAATLSNPKLRARRTPRSTATQIISFEET